MHILYILWVPRRDEDGRASGAFFSYCSASRAYPSQQCFTTCSSTVLQTHASDRHGETSSLDTVIFSCERYDRLLKKPRCIEVTRVKLELSAVYRSNCDPPSFNYTACHTKEFNMPMPGDSNPGPKLLVSVLSGHLRGTDALPRHLARRWSGWEDRVLI